MSVLQHNVFIVTPFDLPSQKHKKNVLLSRRKLAKQEVACLGTEMSVLQILCRGSEQKSPPPISNKVVRKKFRGLNTLIKRSRFLNFVVLILSIVS